MDFKQACHERVVRNGHTCTQSTVSTRQGNPAQNGPLQISTLEQENRIEIRQGFPWSLEGGPQTSIPIRRAGHF